MFEQDSTMTDEVIIHSIAAKLGKLRGEPYNIRNAYYSTIRARICLWSPLPWPTSANPQAKAKISRDIQSKEVSKCRGIGLVPGIVYTRIQQGLKAFSFIVSIIRPPPHSQNLALL